MVCLCVSSETALAKNVEKNVISKEKTFLTFYKKIFKME